MDKSLFSLTPSYQMVSLKNGGNHGNQYGKVPKVNLAKTHIKTKVQNEDL